MKTDHFWGIQYLRAMAALMVVGVHFIITFRPDLGGPTAWTLSRGVNLFFVISGFVMVVTGTHLSAGDFIRRRIARIVPLYWILTCVIVLRAIVAPNLFKNVVVTGPYFIKSLLFIPFANPAAGDTLKPILVPGWTLNYEMFFYAIFALLLLTSKHRLILYTGLVFVGLNLVRWIWEPESFYGQPIVFEFWLGMLIGRYYRLCTLPWIVSATLLVSGFALLLQPWGEYEAMFAAALIVLGAVQLEPYIPKIRAFGLLGDAIATSSAPWRSSFSNAKPPGSTTSPSVRKGDVVYVELIRYVPGSVRDRELQNERIGKAEVCERDLIAAPLAHRWDGAVFSHARACDNLNGNTVSHVIVRIKAGAMGLAGLRGLRAVLKIFVQSRIERRTGRSLHAVGLPAAPLANDRHANRRGTGDSDSCGNG
jgi:exopolysaccharide production protein ExoZ